MLNHLNLSMQAEGLPKTNQYVVEMAAKLNQSDVGSHGTSYCSVVEIHSEEGFSNLPET